MGQITDNLKAAWSFIDSPEKWCQGTLALDSEGDRVSPESPLACKLCSVGALVKYHSSRDNSSVAYNSSIRHLQNTLERHYGPYLPLEDFNDNRTHKQVKTLWLTAIAKAEAEGL